MCDNYTEQAAAVATSGLGRHRSSVRERFTKQLADNQMREEQAKRVLDIFKRHPEFEELVELLEILNKTNY